MRDNLTISTDTQVSDAAVRGHALRRRQGAGRRPRDRVPRQARSSCRRARSTRRRICCAPASVRPGICAISASRCAPMCPASASGCRIIRRSRWRRSSSRTRASSTTTRGGISMLALRYSSKLDGIPPGDMFTVVTNKTSWHAVGEQIGSFIITVYKTYSETGEVKLRLARLARRTDGRFQPAVRSARPRADDGRRAPLRRDAPDAGDAGGDHRSVPGQLQRQGAPGRPGEQEEQAG